MIASLDPNFGGPSVATLGTAAGIQRQGIESLYLLPSGPKELRSASDALEFLAAEGVDVRSFPLSPLGDVARRWGISLQFTRWILVNARRFDIVHVHAAWTYTTIVGLVAARLGGARAVLSTHESLTDFDVQKSVGLKRLLKRVLRALFLSSFDLVVFSSTLECMDSGGARLGPRAVVIAHSVRPLPPFESAPRVVGDDLVVGYLGRLHPKKNLELLFDAVASVPHVTLRIAGGGEAAYREKLEQRTKQLGISDRVTWIGFVDHADKPRFLASLDVLAMPSAYESFGISAVEALGVGVPVVISRRAGVAAVVERCRCGLVVDPSAESVAAALTRLHAERSLLAEFAGNGPRAARDEFSIDAHGERLAAEYRHLIDPPISNVASRALGDQNDHEHRGSSVSSNRPPL